MKRYVLIIIVPIYYCIGEYMGIYIALTKLNCPLTYIPKLY